MAVADDFGIAGQPTILRSGAAAARDKEARNHNAAMGLAIVAESDLLGGGGGGLVHDLDPSNRHQRRESFLGPNIARCNGQNTPAPHFLKKIIQR